MSRDTWPVDGGSTVAVSDIVELWRRALDDGAEGLTVSGGEPLAQAGPLARLLDAVDRVRTGRATNPDILLYTGYEVRELDDEQRLVLDRADAVITGRYEAGRPTRLLWRGSANQELVPRTALGAERYGRYIDLAPERPVVQVAVDDDRMWVIGVPPPGALSIMERSMRSRGVRFGDVAWRP
jgi:anaerobic ribonucleoside-triphosphate reductase activating protein